MGLDGGNGFACQINRMVVIDLRSEKIIRLFAGQCTNRGQWRDDGRRWPIKYQGLDRILFRRGP